MYFQDNKSVCLLILIFTKENYLSFIHSYYIMASKNGAPSGIIEQSLEIMKGTIPSILTMILVNPKQVKGKTVLLTLCLPILTNIIRHYLEILNKRRGLGFEVSLETFCMTTEINVYKYVYDFLLLFNINSDGENSVSIKTIDIKMSDVKFDQNKGNVLVAYFTKENIERYIECKNLNKAESEILYSLCGEKAIIGERGIVGQHSNLITKNGNIARKIIILATISCKKEEKKTYISYTNNDSHYMKYYPITFDNIFLSQKSKIKERIDYWKKQQSYYKRNYLPFKMVMLLHGLPGTGKTSVSQVLAQYLDYGYIEFKLADSDDFKWVERLMCNKSKTVFLIDEIDRVIDSLNQESHIISKDDTTKQINKLGDKLMLFLMRLFESQDIDDVVIILTTNKNPDYFDPALIRPGRIDYIEEFENCDRYQFERIYERYVGGKIPEDYVFPEKKYSPSYIINSVCIPYHDNPKKVLELLQ